MERNGKSPPGTIDRESRKRQLLEDICIRMYGWVSKSRLHYGVLQGSKTIPGILNR